MKLCNDKKYMSYEIARLGISILKVTKSPEHVEGFFVI
jgi:hypothetical protein